MEHRKLLRFAVFVNGGAIMALEVVGTRIMAPWFGVSLYVWSAMIAVTLGALAGGYWAGGCLSQRWGGERILYGLLGGAGLLLLFIPLLRTPLLWHSAQLGLRAGALASALALFGAPLFLLGAVSPYTVHLAADGSGRGPEGAAPAGRAAGELYALSTLGGLVGTLGTGFYLIPAFSVDAIVGLMAGALLSLALVYSFQAGLRRVALVVGCCGAPLWAMGVALTPGPPGPALIRYQSSSLYGEMMVVDLGARRYLLVDGTIQSAMSLDDRRSAIGAHQHIRRLLAAAAEGAGPKGRRGLVIGLAGGLLPRMLEGLAAAIDVVEIDRRTEAVARTFFAYRPGRGRLFFEDGRTFLQRAGPRYDFIVVDAFVAEEAPYHLFSREALAAAHRRLRSGGVLVLNTLGFRRGPSVHVLEAIAATVAAVFGDVHAFATRPEGNFGNVLFVARKGKRAEPGGRAWAPPASTGERLHFNRHATTVLTDAHNPLQVWWAAYGEVTRRALWEKLDARLLLR